jgi:hypothetical protein
MEAIEDEDRPQVAELSQQDQPAGRRQVCRSKASQARRSSGVRGIVPLLKMFNFKMFSSSV